MIDKVQQNHKFNRQIQYRIRQIIAKMWPKLGQKAIPANVQPSLGTRAAGADTARPARAPRGRRPPEPGPGAPPPRSARTLFCSLKCCAFGTKNAVSLRQVHLRSGLNVFFSLRVQVSSDRDRGPRKDSDTVAAGASRPGGSVRGERANLKGLVLGCIKFSLDFGQILFGRLK